MDALAITGIVGTVVTVIALIYAVISSIQSTKQLKEETAHLAFLLEVILKSLQSEGLADLRLDKNGHVIGMNLTVRARTAMLTMIGQPATVTRGSSEQSPTA